MLVGVLSCLALAGALFLAFRPVHKSSQDGGSVVAHQEVAAPPSERVAVPPPVDSKSTDESGAPAWTWSRFLEAAQRDPENAEGFRSKVTGVADPSLESFYAAALTHTNPKVCRIAIENLARLKTPSAAGTLLNRLEHEENIELRWNLFMALSYHIEDQRVHGYVREVAEGPAGPDSSHALWVLTSKRASESDQAFVLQLLEQQSNHEKKSELIVAASSLAMDGSDEACVALVRQLRTLSEPSLRSACFRGLKRAGSLSLLSDSELEEYSSESTPR